ncbi:PDZK1-interacting protein 1 [Labrus bergylta]|uniref:PDZK1-interacting protein 1 n=1 Tax=Labrus bergylta TaxID=56723 RepID=UPI0009B37FCB|nr:small integral membrane protein 24-like [Labrus bergylta]
MEKLGVVISCLLMTVGAVTAQTVQPSERLLPQWLTGIIALVGFLFLTFVVFLMKKAWCDESGRKKSSAEAVTEENSYETSLDLVRRKTEMRQEESETENIYEITLDLVRNDDRNAFNNHAFENTEEKVTSM